MANNTSDNNFWSAFMNPMGMGAEKMKEMNEKFQEKMTDQFQSRMKSAHETGMQNRQLMMQQMQTMMNLQLQQMQQMQTMMMQQLQALQQMQMPSFPFQMPFKMPTMPGFDPQQMPAQFLQSMMNMNSTPENLEKLQKFWDFMFNLYAPAKTEEKAETAVEETEK